MYITAKQRAIINRAVKPCYITSNYLGTDLQDIVKYYCKYFWRRRYPIQHFLPAFRNRPTSFNLTILFNGYHKKYGFGKKNLARRINWKFHNMTFLTKYGLKAYRKERRRRRRRRRRQKRRQTCKSNDRRQSKKTDANATHKITDENSVIVLESTSSNSVDRNVEESHQSDIAKNAWHVEATTGADDTVTIENHSEASANADTKRVELNDDDDTVDNIWNLDIQEVAALITESGSDEKQLAEGMKQTSTQIYVATLFWPHFFGIFFSLILRNFQMFFF